MIPSTTPAGTIMAIDVYLSIDGVKGEPTDSSKQAWIRYRFMALGVMFSTALTCLHCVAAADQPNVLREPVLGLRYEPATVKFDPLPDSAIASCSTLQNDENRRAVWYIYARTTDASSRVYYIIGGYEIPAQVRQGQSRFETDGLGVTLFTEGGQCTILDTARQVFDDRLYDDEMPQQTLRALARDVADRLLRAYGSPERLKRELRYQHVDQDALPAELKESLESYQGPSAGQG
jgi:hypothetical protein